MDTVVHGADIAKYNNNWSRLCSKCSVLPNIKDIQQSTKIHSLLWLVDVTLTAQKEEVQ